MRFDATGIQAHLEEMYGTEVSPSLISSVTDAVVDEVKTWQSRPASSSHLNSVSLKLAAVHIS